MTDENADKKVGSFAAMRQTYRETRPDHRPVPFVLPLVVVTVLAVAAFFLLDARVGALYDQWPDWVLRPARFLTDLGKSWWSITGTVLIIAAGLIVRRVTASQRWQRWSAQAIAMSAYVLIVVAISGLTANFFKRLIGRPRPELFSEQGVFSFNPFMGDSSFESFPSGHATTAGAFWAAMALLFPALRWPFLLFGLYLAITRIFVGAHFPSDILVGYGWGVWFAFFMAVVFARHGIVFSHKDGKLAKLM